MKRRSFLKSLGAASLTPFVPTGLFATAATTPVVPTHTFMWAETLVRAHKTCNLAMLQRHLRIDLGTAQALQTQLISKGVVVAQANAYGIHQAVNPLFDGLPIRSNNVLKDGLEAVRDRVGRLAKADDPVEQVEEELETEDDAEGEEELNNLETATNPEDQLTQG